MACSTRAVASCARETTTREGRRASVPARRALCRASTASSSTENDEDEDEKSSVTTSHTLIGRSIKPDHILEGRPDDALGRLAVEILASETGVDAEALARDVERLFTIVPGLRARVTRGEVTRARAVELAAALDRTTACVLALRRMMREGVDVMGMCAAAPDLLALDAEGLARVRERAMRARSGLEGVCDADAFFEACPGCLLVEDDEMEDISRRARRLKESLPDGDVVKILEKRPSVCLNEDAFVRATKAVNSLRASMPKDCRVGLMLTDFPSLLFVDIDVLLEDLRNTFGGDPCEILRRNPGISTMVRISLNRGALNFFARAPTMTLADVDLRILSRIV